MSINVSVLSGNVGKDPDIITTSSGKKIANISLATTEKYKNQAGEMVTKTDWHRLAAFGKLAEIIEKYVKKGSQIGVKGKLTYNEYEDKNGNKRRDAVINIDEIEFHGSRPQQSEAPQEQTQPETHDEKPGKKAGRPLRAEMGDIDLDENLPF